MLFRSDVFRVLWLEGLETETPTIGDIGFDWKRGDQQVLIIGNDPPEDVLKDLPVSLQGVNLRDHLTATSWLAAWKVKFTPSEEAKKNGKREALAQIAVIDPREADLVRGPARALHTILAARDFGLQTLLPRAAVFNAPSLDGICRWLQDSSAETRTTAAHLPDLLKSSIWNDLISTREQHHALSNVLGAFLLRAQFEERGRQPVEPPIQDFLIALIHACGLAAEPPQGPATERPGSRAWVSEELPSRIGAVLVDDMADLWEDFLRGALGLVDEESQKSHVTASQSFVATGSADFRRIMSGLPDRLARLLSENRRCLTVSDLIPGKYQFERDFLLFLDLRLFPENDRQSTDRFHEQLVMLGKRLLAQKARPLPWLDSRRSEMERELDGNEIAGHPRETLLPRILSLLDPTLPILIFSSTHRTELIDPFRDYANIITTFRKPILSGMSRNWDEIVKELRSDFDSALKRAARVFQVRNTIQTFDHRTNHGESAKLPAGQDGYLVEIFMDESEEPTQNPSPRAICAGGLVVVRALSQVGDPIVSDASIFGNLAAADALWGWCADSPKGFLRPQSTPQRRGYMPKGEDLNFIGNGAGPTLLKAMVARIQDCLGSSGYAFPFALMSDRIKPIPDWMTIQRGVDQWGVEKVLDSTLRRLVQHALEGLLFRSEVLRGALTNSKSQIAIDLAYRDYPCSPNWSFLDAFGIEVKYGKRPSLHSEDGYQITSETVARTGIQWPFPSKIVRARAVALKDFGDNPVCPNDFLPKQLHYFADAISHVALCHPDMLSRPSSSGIEDLERALDQASGVTRQIPEEVVNFFDKGWIVDLRSDAEDQERNEIARLWGQRDRVTAIRRAAQLTKSSPRNGLGIDLFRDLSRWSQELSGPELAQLISIVSLPKGVD